MNKSWQDHSKESLLNGSHIRLTGRRQGERYATNQQSLTQNPKRSKASLLIMVDEESETDINRVKS